jgi:adenylate cyclase
VVAVKGKSQGQRVWEPLAMADDPEAAAARGRAARALEALEAYLARDFGRAAHAYAELLAAHPTDRAASLMLERCRAFEAHPPPAGWDGVAVMEHK